MATERHNTIECRSQFRTNDDRLAEHHGRILDAAHHVDNQPRAAAIRVRTVRIRARYYPRRTGGEPPPPLDRARASSAMNRAAALREVRILRRTQTDTVWCGS